MICDTDVSFDGGYMTRGLSPRVGVPAVIGCETGKVLNTGSRSKICKYCEYWDTHNAANASTDLTVMKSDFKLIIGFVMSGYMF